ncbi:MAG: type II CRISPR-associated endonuclease Cas1 [Sedimentibacter saalensis]|uniref:type II CRISPR-associated endonuclease Cas1 n=1 Tax=Sedimentibacter saalensis TaxID=130788 RepID=UPI002B207BAA|nr:type II CRISPR-associated endonuclease Cas1 [Sedimentibacter saalensis]MEA5094583.1 type II CRISPR-associated endonuclease Cas1 [Sedimentibacter saalensis]
MSWRVVVISQRAKLDLKLNNLVVRSESSTTKIHLGEISLLMIENTSVSLTSCLLCELMNRKIKVIFCDEKRNPSSELVPYYGSHDCSAKLKGQLEWKTYTKDLVWTEIVREKIRKQKDLLHNLGRNESKMLDEYIKQIEFKDETNREGHAAKVYFNSLFGLNFTRAAENNINAALNYGYSILLSAFNREVVANGYVTQLGLFHDNMFNQFNLSSDLMEPFRPLIDFLVYEMNPQCFEHEEKMQIVNILNEKIIIDGKIQFVNNAIKIYCKCIFDALNENDVSLIRFYRNEL